MARYAKVSTIGAPLISVDETLSFDEAIKAIEETLMSKIKPVLPDKPDLILMPEMCDVPINYNLQQREAFLKHRGGSHIRFFGKIAKENHCNIGFCTYRYGASDYTLNTMYVLDREGNIAGRYNKNHIVMPLERDQNVRGGVDTPIIQLDIGRIACIICFDLNFDTTREAYKAQKPEIILFSSMYHGGIVQQFWAQSCRAFFIGAISNSYPSAVISPMGETLAYSTNYTPYATTTINLDYALAHHDYNTEKFVALKEKYGTRVTFFEPGNIGYVQITSECPDISVSEMVKEFEITLLDDYLDGALAAQKLPQNCGAVSE
ncbi:MAG: carbon-nitrogen hydrolase family protein [Defluviitaleaceae bacterium]|nr:carbon-nitrogen hydrolase family protein [Defluviitaleaceae bacterium]